VSQDPPEPGREVLARPFLTDPRPAGLPPEAGPEGSDDQQVRPYLMTGGRTSAQRGAVAIETVVVVSPLASGKPAPGVRFERAQILRLCREPRSVAEVSALLRVPLGVARVLVADLVTEGLLDARASRPRVALDVQFLERLIDGVSAL
jgi:Protein of unknown function (DUF742)